MKTIVALVDFSDVTSSVLKHVETLAKAFKSHVTVLHGVPMMPVVIDGGPVTPSDLTAEEAAADLERLQKITEPLRACGADVTLEQFRDMTIENLVEKTLRYGADLIVVGSHRHSSIYNLLVGSVTHSILKHAKCPVLVVST